MRTVKALADWTKSRGSSTIRGLQGKQPNDWFGSYVRTVLAELGMKVPTKGSTWESQWPELLRKQLQFKVRLFARKS